MWACHAGPARVRSFPSTGYAGATNIVLQFVDRRRVALGILE